MGWEGERERRGVCCGLRAHFTANSIICCRRRAQAVSNAAAAATHGKFTEVMRACEWSGANFYSGARVYVNEYESRAQPLQSGCSVRVTRCLCAPVPANGLGLVFTNASTALVKASDIEQCCRMFLGGGKLVQPQPFSVVLNNAKAIGVHEAQVVLRPNKVLRCSQPIQRKRLGIILRNASFTSPIQHAERKLPVSAALP